MTLKRSWLKRGDKPLKSKVGLSRRAGLKRTSSKHDNSKRRFGLSRKKSAQTKRNERLKWLSDHHKDWIHSLCCEVTGLPYPERAHTRRRSQGGKWYEIVPLNWRVHLDFDNPAMSDEAFEAKWERTRQSIRERASYYAETYRRSYPDQYLRARLDV